MYPARLWPDTTRTEAAVIPLPVVAANVQWTPEELADGVVHVYVADLDSPPVDQNILSGWLSPVEQSRAARLLSATVARRQAVSRGLLRWLLGAYMDVSPSQIALAAGSHGKPQLVPENSSLHFNLSHCENLALFAITSMGPVGADLEIIRTVKHLSGLMDICFSPRERQVIDKLEDRAQQEAFFRCWTLKEACIKNSGKGFSTPLTQVTVDFWSSEPNLTAILEKRETGLKLKSFLIADQVAAALALTTQEDFEIKLWQLTTAR